MYSPLVVAMDVMATMIMATDRDTAFEPIVGNPI
jgi:hypothetical protein